MEEVESQVNKVDVNLETVNLKTDQNLEAIRKENANPHGKCFQMIENVMNARSAGRRPRQPRDVDQESNRNYHLPQYRRHSSRNDRQ